MKYQWDFPRKLHIFTREDIEGISWPRVDMNFIFECSTRYLTGERSERVRYRGEHEKIKFISTSGHVILCLLYKHQIKSCEKGAIYYVTITTVISSRVKITCFIFFSGIWAGRMPKSSSLIGWSYTRDRSSFLRYGPRAGFFPAAGPAA